MGWRSRLGLIEKDFTISELYPQKNQKSAENEKPFTDITGITHKVLNLKIEGMDTCLHGKKCKFLVNDPPKRVICRFVNRPIFDLEWCPDTKWGMNHNCSVVKRLKELVKLADQSKGMEPEKIAAISTEGSKIMAMLPDSVVKEVFSRKDTV